MDIGIKNLVKKARKTAKKCHALQYKIERIADEIAQCVDVNDGWERYRDELMDHGLEELSNTLLEFSNKYRGA